MDGVTYFLDSMAGIFCRFGKGLDDIRLFFSAGMTRVSDADETPATLQFC
jgi:hypothetical protein